VGPGGCRSSKRRQLLPAAYPSSKIRGADTDLVTSVRYAVRHNCWSLQLVSTTTAKSSGPASASNSFPRSKSLQQPTLNLNYQCVFAYDNALPSMILRCRCCFPTGLIHSAYIASLRLLGWIPLHFPTIHRHHHLQCPARRRHPLRRLPRRVPRHLL
jgi:hypothetical protein